MQRDTGQRPERSGHVTRRHFIRIAGVTCGSMAVLGLAACGSDDSGESANAQSGGTYSGDFAFGQLNAVLAGAVGFYCEAQGIFADHGLDLELIDAEGGATSIHVVESNTSVGVVSAVAAATVASKGLGELKIISGFVNTPTTLWVAPKASPVTADDLRGKKIGTSSPDSLTTYFANVLARDRGLKVGEDVEVVFIGGAPDAWTAVENGVVDVAWSAIPYSDVLLASEGAKVVVDNADLQPVFVDNVMVATESFIEENPDAVRAMMRAFDEGIKGIRADPAKAGAIWARAIDIPESIATEVLRKHADSLSLRIDREGIGAAAQAAVDLGGADQVPDLDELIDDRYLPAHVA